MNKRFCRFIFVAGIAVLLTACGNKETKDALDKSTALEAQKQYQDANNILVEALRAREAQIRTAAGNPSDQAAIEALEKRVQGDSEILKMERAQIPLYLHLERADLASAVFADVQKGSPGDTVVVNLLHDKDATIRTGAVRILGLAQNPTAVDALTTATTDEDKDVRRAAVVALGTIKDPRTLPPLIAALKDSYWDVRSEAANALGQKKDGSAVKPLLETVSDADSTVESSAETALLFLSKPMQTSDGQKGAAPASADEFASHLNDPNSKIVLISAVCLAIMKDSRCVPVLLKMVSSTDATTRLDAVKGLGETGDPSVIPTLRQTLKDPDVNMRGWSIIGLGALKDTGSLPDLRAIDADPAEPATIKAAVEAAINHIAPPETSAAGQ
jgi:HEAT repeat protein